ncbi:MAG: hypothetical protein GYA57_06250 [Myxococcales bacterium]|nr:hypothetical protein [Myxococcales bacterium]
MTIGSVGGTGSTTGIGQVSHDVGDIAFLVALLEVEMLDTEISGRLNEMKGLNAVRKAYNERIAELQRLVDQCAEDGQVEIPLSSAQRGSYVWDPEANGGTGGVVLRAEGDMMGTGEYSVHRADGSQACFGDLLDAFNTVSPILVGDWLERFPRFMDPMDWVSHRDDPIETRDPAKAQAYAEMMGGTVMVTVTRDQLTGEMQTLRDKLDGLSSDAEIGMLGLNRLLSRRNQVLQLASNVMSSQHQTTMGIIANLKV